MNITFDITPPLRRAKPISLTALIDVVFILLMFFMLTSSFNQWQTLDLLTPSEHSQAELAAPPVVIIYKNEMGLLTDTLQRPIKLSQIQAKLNLKNDKDPVIISAVNDVPISRLVTHYEQLKKLGIKNLQIGQSIKQPKQRGK